MAGGFASVLAMSSRVKIALRWLKWLILGGLIGLVLVYLAGLVWLNVPAGKAWVGGKLHAKLGGVWHYDSVMVDPWRGVRVSELSMHSQLAGAYDLQVANVQAVPYWLEVLAGKKRLKLVVVDDPQVNGDADQLLELVKQMAERNRRVATVSGQLAARQAEDPLAAGQVADSDRPAGDGDTSVAAGSAPAAVDLAGGVSVAEGDEVAAEATPAGSAGGGTGQDHTAVAGLEKQMEPAGTTAQGAASSGATTGPAVVEPARVQPKRAAVDVKKSWPCEIKVRGGGGKLSWRDDELVALDGVSLGVVVGAGEQDVRVKFSEISVHGVQLLESADSIEIPASWKGRHLQIDYESGADAWLKMQANVRLSPFAGGVVVVNAVIPQQDVSWVTEGDFPNELAAMISAASQLGGGAGDFFQCDVAGLAGGFQLAGNLRQLRSFRARAAIQSGKVKLATQPGRPLHQFERLQASLLANGGVVKTSMCRLQSEELTLFGQLTADVAGHVQAVTRVVCSPEAESWMSGQLRQLHWLGEGDHWGEPLDTPDVWYRDYYLMGDPAGYYVNLKKPLEFLKVWGRR